VLQFDWAMVAHETRKLYGQLIPLTTTS
jgi:hypothetical protein